MNNGETEHIFKAHLLSPVSGLPLPNPQTPEVWPSVFLFVCLVLLVLVKMRAFPRMVKIVQSVYSAQALQQLEREETNLFRLYSLILVTLFVLNLSFLTYRINLAYHFVLPQSNHLQQFFVLMFFVLLLYGIKYTGNRALVFITGEDALIRNYETVASHVNQALGLFLFPWMVLAQFSKFNPLVFVSGALITLAVAVILKWYKGVMGCLGNGQVGLLQIFSYFCALEILPVAVMVKYVIESY